MQLSPRCAKCSVKHTKHYYNTKNMAAVKIGEFSQMNTHKDDRLPVVEVKPFTKQVWRKAKSYPDYYERHHSAPQAPKKEKEVETTGFPDPNKVSVRDSSCSRAQTSVSERSPKVKNNTKISQEGKYFSNPPKGFATLGDRSKTTLDDIKSGENQNTYYSLLPRARSEMDLSPEKGIQLQGQRINEGQAGKKTEFYMEPWQYYFEQKFDGARMEERHGTEDLMLRMDHISNVYKDGTIYDAFERSHTLPSINIKPKVLRKRRKKNDSRKSSARLSAYQHRGYQTGVQNTLDLMSQVGKPIGLEDQLSMRLRNTLHNLRTSKSINGVSFDRSLETHPRLDRAATVGETMIYRGTNRNTADINSNRKIIPNSNRKERNDFQQGRATDFSPAEIHSVKRTYGANFVVNSRNSQELVPKFKTFDILEQEENGETFKFKNQKRDNENEVPVTDTREVQQNTSEEQMIKVVQESNSARFSPVHIPAPIETKMSGTSDEKIRENDSAISVRNSESWPDKPDNIKEIPKEGEHRRDATEILMDNDTFCNEESGRVGNEAEKDCNHNDIHKSKDITCDIESITSDSVNDSDIVNEESDLKS